MTAFLMECYENGILNKERTGGLELVWGNAEAELELLHQMARNEGFGKIAAAIWKPQAEKSILQRRAGAIWIL